MWISIKLHSKLVETDRKTDNARTQRFPGLWPQDWF